MRLFFKLMLFLCIGQGFAQTATLSGILLDEEQQPLAYAHAILFAVNDSSMVKSGITNEEGMFQLKSIPKGSYYLECSMLGYENMHIKDIILKVNQNLALGVQLMNPATEVLNEVTITPSRPIILVKQDRTILNVEGTVNSVGFDVISLLRKAPAVTVDHNNNISILGRSGVLVYVNGKQLPLTGDALGNYLQNLSSEQIDRLEVITHPDVRYDAEGDAGIIDIKLKKDKYLGANGTLKTTYSQGVYARSTIASSGNFRDKKMNLYGNIARSDNTGFNQSSYDNYQNGFRLLEINNFKSHARAYNIQLGTDFFLGTNHTLGLMVNGSNGTVDRNLPSHIEIYDQNTPYQLDSLLRVEGAMAVKRQQQTNNLRYAFDSGRGRQLTIDLDYGNYSNETERFQPNRFYGLDNELLSEEISEIKAQTDIDIYTAKLDNVDSLWGGTLSLGSKLSRIETENNYLFFDETDGGQLQNNQRSRLFNYTENIYAAYVNYKKSISRSVQLSLGVRTEKTKAEGRLEAFVSQLDEPPVSLNFQNWFPSLALNWRASEQNSFSFNYGRRINRPNYYVLNPFRDQITQLSFEKGNPFLRPEIVDKVEIGYTKSSNYNFKLYYSHAKDKVTRLVGPDESDPRATFGTYANLGTQKVLGGSSNFSFSVDNWYQTNLNISAAFIDNNANFGGNAIVDLQLFSYKLTSQHTFRLLNGTSADISGYYNGPSVFGGNFKMEPNWSMDIGLQRKFMSDRINVRLMAQDIFYQSGFEGLAGFDGLRYFGKGRRDSRRISINLSYIFGNQHIKSKARHKGMENEEKRI